MEIKKSVVAEFLNEVGYIGEIEPGDEAILKDVISQVVKDRNRAIQKNHRVEIGRHIAEQDNRCTAHPMWFVFQGSHTKMRDPQVFFTAAAAEEYTARHPELQLSCYIHSGHKNEEWQEARAMFLKVYEDECFKDAWEKYCDKCSGTGAFCNACGGTGFGKDGAR